MKIRLLDKPSKDIHPRVQVMLNRGIAPMDIKKYIHNGTSNIYNPEVFGIELLQSGVKLLFSHIMKNNKVRLIVDSDCDGMTSAAYMINYLFESFSSWTENNLTWYMHEGKQHGLNDFIDELENSDCKLVICPDSATNDVEAIERLHNKGIDVLILDHHLSDVPMSPYAVTINSQYNYPNPFLSGVGVVHKFCQYFDKLLDKNYSNKFLDLTSIGMMGDMMSMVSIETKEMIFEGLKDENIVNPLIAGLAKKNEFALKKSDYIPSKYNDLSITPIGAAFFIIPMLNAICRSGTMEEKKLVFNSMLTMKAFEVVPSTKRGHKIGETERIVDQALRCCTNVKKHQDDAVKASMELLEDKVQALLINKVLVLEVTPEEVHPNIAGLVANKMQSKYQRPCCVVFKTESSKPISWYYEDEEYINWNGYEYENGKGVWGTKDIPVSLYAGSMRGYTATGINDFKSVAEKSQYCEWVRGHENAAGICISNIDKFIADMNEELKDISTEIVFYVDYIWDEDYIDPNTILILASMNDYIGTDFSRPLVYIRDVDASTLQVMKSNTLKFTTSSNVSLISFNATEEDIAKLSQPNIKINAVCKCATNEWGGTISAQLQIVDYEIIEPTGIDIWGF